MKGLPSWGRAVIPPLVLALVAAVQIYRAQFQRLTPWKGGGFGMFAQNDSSSSRLLRCWVTMKGPEGQLMRTLVPVPERTGLAPLVQEVLAAPTADHVQTLTEALAQEKWRFFEEQASDWRTEDAPKSLLLVRAEPQSGTTDTGVPAPVHQVEVRVYRAKFDTSASQIVPELIEGRVVTWARTEGPKVARREGEES